MNVPSPRPAGHDSLTDGLQEHFAPLLTPDDAFMARIGHCVDVLEESARVNEARVGALREALERQRSRSRRGALAAFAAGFASGTAFALAMPWITSLMETLPARAAVALGEAGRYLQQSDVARHVDVPALVVEVPAGVHSAVVCMAWMLAAVATLTAAVGAYGRVAR